jgi:hypothetical protein
MKMTDYKKYALGQVENFLYDAMSSGATPQEIYDVIKGVVEDNYYTYKKCASEAYELLALLNGNGVGHIQAYDDYLEKGENLQYTDEELNVMCDKAEAEDKVNKWVLPVEYIDDENFVSLPEDLLEAANLKEGDVVDWIDQGDGSFKMIKVTKPIEMEEC